jgi:hypothetical protein
MPRLKTVLRRKRRKSLTSKRRIEMWDEFGDLFLSPLERRNQAFNKLIYLVKCRLSLTPKDRRNKLRRLEHQYERFLKEYGAALEIERQERREMDVMVSNALVDRFNPKSRVVVYQSINDFR